MLQAVQWLLQLTRAMLVLHSHRPLMIHRDLKVATHRPGRFPVAVWSCVRPEAHILEHIFQQDAHDV
jgi:hypothetical protein